MHEFLKRTWAEIDLNAIGHNFRAIRSTLKPGVKMCCVVKADAYGHGAPMVAREYQRLGADWFAVSNLEEAIQLRRCAITRPILILGYTPPQKAEELSELNISQSVLSLDYARQLSGYAQVAGVQVKMHLKVDTGMSRIGFVYQTPDESADSLNEMEEACRLPGLIPEGVFTHFAVADDGSDGEEFTLRQFACFKEAIDTLENRGIHFAIRHCANSGAVVDYPELQLDMVRPGIILYGMEPSDSVQHPLDLRPAMELKTVISQKKAIPAGATVSYGRTFTAEKETIIATVPIGYADGYPRKFSGKAEMLVHGKRAPIVGRVCMDQLMLDVTDIPEAREGDVVTVFGRDGNAFLPVDELAALNDTIHYEMVCLVGKRVPRIYWKNGKQVGELNYICPAE